MEKLLRYIGKDIQDIRFESWLNQKPIQLHAMAEKWFEVIKTCGDDVQPIFHDGYPMGCVDHVPFAYLNVFSAHVNVGFFYGAFLRDKVGLLEGSGKRMRHVKLFPDVQENDKAIRALIEAAYIDIHNRLNQE